MEKNKKKREPLLYIQQPDFTFPDPVMQSTYHIKDGQDEELKKLEKELPALEVEQVKEEQLKPDESSEQPIADKLTEQPEQGKEEPVHEERRKERPSWMKIQPLKRFQDMHIDEKLQYLTKQFAKLPCLFECGEASHAGVLVGVTPDQIRVQTHNDGEVTIERKDLKHIRLLGSF
ncbi:CotO family spore coat protein [Bacillus thermotolerans]|uniref:Spore coat protein CotO n=1 Tax=Bacillus thermotolerans TaxID=1221996 RepID=A0A0F5HYL0_BACTR|nr:CotO family spore coat protein [Bacillus thermotolerans]KKB38100.1 hypothetical protein QY97_03475 [Bacillus thermotolerans]KKB40761.1 hypothetical protein QY95_01335 [Bacillus thermotolerans]